MHTEDGLLPVIDPRLEHFTDPRINSYSHRGFDLPNTSIAGGKLSTRRPFYLSVRNIPGGMGRSGMFNLFRPFGNLLDCFVAKSVEGKDRWGWVSFSTSASSALTQLRGAPPCNLVVEWLESKADRERRRMEEQEEEQFTESVVQQFDEEVGSRVDWAEKELQTVVEPAAKVLSSDESETFNSPVDTLFTYGTPLVIEHHHQAQAPSPCVRCEARGQLVCSVCQAWHCSRLCHAATWPQQHEMLCQARLTSHLTEVVVTSTGESEDTFFVQTIACQENLSSLMAGLQGMSKTAVPLGPLVPGALYCVRAGAGRLVFRARLVTVGLDKAKVFLIDYGIIDLVPVDQIFALNGSLVALPPLCVHLELVGEGQLTTGEVVVAREVGEGERVFRVRLMRILCQMSLGCD